MSVFTFRKFTPDDIPEMRTVFNRSFADYIVPLKLNAHNFQKKIIEKTNISFSNSIGCHANNEWVGFIFNSVNLYEKKKTAYNGGTGVLPDFRGNHLTQRMYEHIIPDLTDAGIDQCILEVIADNSPALKSYLKVGFRRTTFLHCLKMDNQSDYLHKKKRNPFKLIKTINPLWNQYQTFCDYHSSFLDSLTMLEINKSNETIYEVHENNEVIGFIIFNEEMGRIGHIGVHPKHRGRGIGTALIQKVWSTSGY